jgi:nicotinate-nucleotide adenylyltransferase
MRRIGLFGGTFNPPHVGHLRLATVAADAAALDMVILMPANVPPHKQAPDLASGEDRLALCRATFRDPRFIVSDMELRRKGKSYTVDTLRALQDCYPADRLFLIIGSDMLLSFDRWFCWQEILSLCSLLVLSREPSITPAMLRAYAVDTLGLTEEDFRILETEPLELSSTAIRAAIAAGEDASAALTDAAYAYIREKGLYL